MTPFKRLEILSEDKLKEVDQAALKHTADVAPTKIYITTTTAPAGLIPAGAVVLVDTQHAIGGTSPGTAFKLHYDADDQTYVSYEGNIKDLPSLVDLNAVKLRRIQEVLCHVETADLQAELDRRAGK